ncbi:hypothetical protein NDU88_002280 [Pleurodeles waltl]|uniref:Uncharacterized protein n=1 Tax=Pleurodeles waltl TaxID=8319 RepID=A0AAV7Q8V4_PLEWA|nr:hypothetical protein NDU88_002280 [Pleurodeles waltl]
MRQCGADNIVPLRHNEKNPVLTLACLQCTSGSARRRKDDAKRAGGCEEDVGRAERHEDDVGRAGRRENDVVRASGRKENVGRAGGREENARGARTAEGSRRHGLQKEGRGNGEAEQPQNERIEGEQRTVKVVKSPFWDLTARNVPGGTWLAQVRAIFGAL